MWQLNKKGEFVAAPSEPSSNSVLLDPSVKEQVYEASTVELNAESQIRINFASHADGRGFSLARQLTEKFQGHDETPQIIAVGKLIPDQARLAFQSGFDLIEIADEEVDRHSEAAWRNSLKNTVPHIYVEPKGDLAGVTNIWSARQK